MSNSNDLKTRVEVWKHYKTKNAAGTPNNNNFQFYKYTYASIKITSGDSPTADTTGQLPTTYVNIILRYDPQIDYDCEIHKKVKKQPAREQISDDADKFQKYSINFVEDIGNNFLRLRCTTYNEYI